MVTGGFLTKGEAEEQLRQLKDPQRWFAPEVDRWRKQLNLTQEQQEKIKPILQQMADEFGNARSIYMRETDAILSRTEDRMKNFLNPEQQGQLRPIIEDRRQRMRQWLNPVETRNQSD